MLSYYEGMESVLDNVSKSIKLLGYTSYEYIKNKPRIKSLNQIEFIKKLICYISSKENHVIEFYYDKYNIEIYEIEKFNIHDKVRILNFIEIYKNEILSEYFNFYIYDSTIIDFQVVDSSNSLNRFITENHNNKLSLLNETSKLPIPSSFESINSFRNEQLLTNQIIQKVPDAFHHKYKYIDILISISLKGAPSRLRQVYSSKFTLLDYLSKEEKKTSYEIITFPYNFDEIVDEDSDTVSILSTLSTLSAEEQLTLGKLANYYTDSNNNLKIDDFNKLPLTQKFIGEIEKRDNRFQYIHNPKVLFDDTIVSSKLQMNPIDNKNSIFMLIGLSNEIFSKEYFGEGILKTMYRVINREHDNVNLNTISLLTLQKMSRIFLKLKGKYQLTYIPRNYNYSFKRKWEVYQFGNWYEK